VLLSGLMALPGLASAGAFTGNVNLFLGAKTLDDTDWYAYQHAEGGILVDIGQTGWPVNLAVDMLASSGDETLWAYVPGYGYAPYKEEVDTSEVNLGLRKSWELASNMHPYVGGGLAFIHLDAKGTVLGFGTVTDEGDGTGVWLNGGIYWTVQSLNLGFDVRYSEATVNMHYGDFEGGGGHAGLLVGYHW